MIQDPTTGKQKPPWPVVDDGNIGTNYGTGDRVKVRCIDPRGIYYNFNRRREGDVFELIPMWITLLDKKTGFPVKKDGEVQKEIISAMAQFSDRTMELVEDDEPTNLTTSKQALLKKQNELTESKASR